MAATRCPAAALATALVQQVQEANPEYLYARCLLWHAAEGCTQLASRVQRTAVVGAPLRKHLLSHPKRQAHPQHLMSHRPLQVEAQPVVPQIPEEVLLVHVLPRLGDSALAAATCTARGWRRMAARQSRKLMHGRRSGLGDDAGAALQDVFGCL